MFNFAGNDYNPHLKIWALLFLAVSGIFAGGVLAQGPLFHGHSPLILFEQPKYSGNRVVLTMNTTTDPFTTIWSGGIASGNLNGYSASGGVYNGGCTCIQIGNGTSNNGGQVVGKSQIGMDLASAKELTIEQEWQWLGVRYGPGANKFVYPGQWGWFLTTNSTVSQSSTYNPYYDNNVVLDSVFSFSGNNETIAHNLFVSRAIGRSVASDDYGNCSSGSSCMFAGSFGTANLDPGDVFVSDLVLNFTGHSPVAGQAGGTGVNFGVSNDCIGPNGVGGSSCAIGGFGDNILIDTMNSNGTILTTQLFPWLSLTTPVYVGYFNTGVSVLYGNPEIGWLETNSGVFANNFMCYYVPLPTVATPATPDTGGFLGPVVKALIAIGVFIISNLFAFASYLWNILQPVFTAIVNLLIVGFAGFATLILGVIKAVLNAIGTGLGISNLGDNLFTLFGDVSSFFTTFFGNALAQVSSFITFLNNGYTTVSSTFSTYWTDVTNWTSAIKDLLGGLWTIVGQLTTLPFVFVFSGWLLYGAKKFSDNLSEGMEWFSMTRLFLLIGFNIALWLLTFLIVHVVTPSMHAIMATGEAKKTAEPDIVIGGTGVG